MRDRFSHSMIMAAVAAAGGTVTCISLTPTSAQPPAASVTTPAAALKTPWGEPDLQGIWKDEFDTPLQRNAKYAAQEFFTELQRAELDKERATLVERRGARGDADVTGGLLLNPTSTRTPDGRVPALTPERSPPPPIGNSVLRCCRQPKHARTNWSAVRAGHTIQSPRRNALSLLLATTRASLGRASIATTVRRTVRWRIAA
jgi:hypothetical protein